MDNTRQPYILQNGIGAIPPGTPRCRQPKRKSPFIRHQTLSESDCREVCRSHRTLEKFGRNPETFREYLYEHKPELAASLGMTRLASGKQVLARCAEKYDEAVHLYATTTEPLKSIALKLGLQYNSVGGFVRRNRPDGRA